MANGIYNSDGSIRTTTVPGTSWTGLYAADGSLNIVVNDSSHNGLYHPCGAVRVNSDTSKPWLLYDSSGAWYLPNILGGSGQRGTGTTPTSTPTYYILGF